MDKEELRKKMIQNYLALFAKGVYTQCLMCKWFIKNEKKELDLFYKGNRVPDGKCDCPDFSPSSRSKIRSYNSKVQIEALTETKMFTGHCDNFKSKGPSFLKDWADRIEDDQEE